MKQLIAASAVLATMIIANSSAHAASLPHDGMEPLVTDSPAGPPASSSFKASLAVLRALMQREVLGLKLSASHKQRLMDLAWSLLQQVPDWEMNKPQVLLVVDRSPAVQEMLVIGAFPGEPWEVIGATHISTGKPGRKEHFLTPIGVFRNTADILGYRAEGTTNENGVRGLGVKGMRVWDFGWQRTDDWRWQGAKIDIRMEMHATDPDLLEQRLGRPDSEGCIRIEAAMNHFLDKYGVIDAQLEVAAKTDPRFAALLRADRVPTAIAGSLLIIVDSLTEGRNGPATSKATRDAPLLRDLE